MIPTHRHTNDAPTPTALTSRASQAVLELQYDGHGLFELSFEFLRVYSPSAEVLGHGPGQEVLQTGKRKVQIVAIEPVGHYAIKPSFSDNHDTGIYSWSYLWWLCQNQEALWARYLERLEEASGSRD
ncbi:MAG: DUF971 domain-containing protein [Burkholderiaceae bacterium]|jgi:DUF971 family protein|nr:DUF971 domain-containing protein [Burkholderiaceae bacterium]